MSHFQNLKLTTVSFRRLTAERLLGVTGGGLDPDSVHALFVNIDNMWTERFGNYDYLVICSLLSDCGSTGAD